MRFPSPPVLRTPQGHAARASIENGCCGYTLDWVNKLRKHGKEPLDVRMRMNETVKFGRGGETLVQVCDNPPVSGGWDWVAARSPSLNS